jgi:hypothetical protein
VRFDVNTAIGDILDSSLSKYRRALRMFEFLVAVYFCQKSKRSVSEAYGPLRPSLDAGPCSSAVQRQGMSSSMRLLGQPLTRRVSTSVK